MLLPVSQFFFFSLSSWSVNTCFIYIFNYVILWTITRLYYWESRKQQHTPGMSMNLRADVQWPISSRLKWCHGWSRSLLCIGYWDNHLWLKALAVQLGLCTHNQHTLINETYLDKRKCILIKSFNTNTVKNCTKWEGLPHTVGIGYPILLGRIQDNSALALKSWGFLLHIIHRQQGLSWR